MTSPLLLLLLGVSLSCAQVKIYDLRASGLDHDPVGHPDAFVKVFCGSASLGQTAIKNNEANPWWSDEFSYFDARENDMLRLEVIDKNVKYDDFLGACGQQLKVGTYRHDCSLEAGGTLYYSYTLHAPPQH